MLKLSAQRHSVRSRLCRNASLWRRLLAYCACAKPGPSASSWQSRWSSRKTCRREVPSNPAASFTRNSPRSTHGAKRCWVTMRFSHATRADDLNS
jgi:hypothetical protein